MLKFVRYSLRLKKKEGRREKTEREREKEMIGGEKSYERFDLYNSDLEDFRLEIIPDWSLYEQRVSSLRRSRVVRLSRLFRITLQSQQYRFDLTRRFLGNDEKLQTCMLATAYAIY